MFSRINAIGWAFLEPVSHDQMNAMDIDHANAIDGVNGGTYNLAAALNLVGPSTGGSFGLTSTTASMYSPNGSHGFVASDTKVQWSGTWEGAASATLKLINGTTLSALLGSIVSLAGSTTIEASGDLGVDGAVDLNNGSILTAHAGSEQRLQGLFKLLSGGNVAWRFMTTGGPPAPGTGLDSNTTVGAGVADFYFVQALGANRTYTLDTAAATAGNIMFFSRYGALDGFTADVGGVVTLSTTVGQIGAALLIYDGSAWQLLMAWKN